MSSRDLSTKPRADTKKNALNSWEEVLEAALALPEDDQWELLERLRIAMGCYDDGLSEEWKAEIQRRCEEIDQGKAKLMTLSEFKRAMKKLRSTARAKRS